MKRVFMAISGYLREMDKLLVFLAFCLTGAGLLTLFGCLSYFNSGLRSFGVQVVAFIVGMVAAVILSLFDYHTLARLWKFHLPVALFLVLLTFLIGTGREGADDRAWLALPGGMTLQPTEFLKISYILTFAWHIERSKEAGNFNSLVSIGLLCLHGAAYVLLIHFQGDDGTAIVFFIIFLAMMFAGGLDWKYFAGGGLVAIPVGVLAWFFILDDTHRNRIMALFDPTMNVETTGWQPLLGRLAIGSGQLFGRGLFGKHQNVPEVHNDFIFAFFAESFGFVGAALLLAIFVAFLIRILRNGFGARDSLGTVICVGVFAMYAAQIIINIGMCISVLPVIGVTLPFFSSGGSSALTVWTAIGLVLSVASHRRASIFEQNSIRIERD